MSKRPAKRQRRDESDTESEDESDRKVTSETQSRWWWFTIHFDTPDEAIDWRIPDSPKVKYAIYRAHLSPTTGKPHVHCLVNYTSSIRWITLKNKGYTYIKFRKDKTKRARCRNYVLNPFHRNGSSKGVLAPVIETGIWKI